MKSVATRLAAKRDEVTKRYLNHPALKRPLMFGDVGQIAALYAWRSEMASLDPEPSPSGGLSRYEIEYTVLETRRAVVIAHDGETAAEMLRDEEPDVEDIEGVTRVGDAATDDEEGVEESDIY